MNLHTGRWTFDKAVPKFFMEAGGLDREAAEGEAAGAAASPTQEVTYMTGKWRVASSCGKWRQREPPSASAISTTRCSPAGACRSRYVEWILFDDPSSVEKALGSADLTPEASTLAGPAPGSRPGDDARRKRG